MDKKKIILLVEDERVTAKFESSILKKEGYSVLLAHSGEEAIEIFNSGKHIDLVLIDIDLGSGMDGTTTAEKILQVKTVPVVFLSSHTEPSIVKKPEGITSYGYVVKNSGDTVLFASIKMVFKLFAAHQEIVVREKKLSDALEKQKKIEHELKKSQELFNLFMEYSPIYVFFKDENIRSIHLSQNYEKMLGKPMEELLGKSMFDLFPSELARNMVEDDKAILDSGKPFEVVETFDEHIYATTKFPIVRNNKPTYLAGFTIDITAQKKAEEDLSKALKEKDALLWELSHRVKTV